MGYGWVTDGLRTSFGRVSDGLYGFRAGYGRVTDAGVSDVFRRPGRAPRVYMKLTNANTYQKDRILTRRRRTYGNAHRMYVTTFLSQFTNVPRFFQISS